MVNQSATRDEEEPLILDEGNADEVTFGDITREFSIMGWIGFGGERVSDSRSGRQSDAHR